MDISANRAYTIPRVVFGEGYAIHQACGEPFVLGVRDDGVGGHGVGVLGFGLHGSTGGGAGLGDGGGDGGWCDGGRVAIAVRFGIDVCRGQGKGTPSLNAPRGRDECATIVVERLCRFRRRGGRDLDPVRIVPAPVSGGRDARFFGGGRPRHLRATAPWKAPRQP